MHCRMKSIRVITLVTLLVLFAAGQALADTPQFADLAEKAGPAVVNVFTETKPKQQEMPDIRRQFRGMPFGDDFFEQFNQLFNQRPQRSERSLGSGFLISADGYILTNNHVVEKADKVSVKLQKGEKVFQAKVIGTDPDTDLALIKIEDGKDLPYLKLGDSSKERVGNWVMAIGNPFGLSNTVTKGIISAKGRVIGAGPYDDFIQTDASINPGNSGGPLLNMDGDVIGINSAIIASGQGIGFAIPSDVAKQIVDQLKSKGKVTRGMLGITIQGVDENAAKALGLSSQKGALVNQANPGSPGEKAGLTSGDVITEINGQPVADAHDLTAKIGAMAPGSTVSLTYFRKGEKHTAKATLVERDTKKFGQDEDVSSDSDQSGDVLGMSLSTTNPRTGHSAGGLVVTQVQPGSVAAEAGIREGDVILQVNQQHVETAKEAAQIIRKEGKANGAVLLLFKRQSQTILMSIPVE